MAAQTTTDLISELETKKLVQLVRVAETAECYEDMCLFVAKLIMLKCSKGQDLDVDERNLFSVAFKNVVGSKRAQWRTLNQGIDGADNEIMDKYKKIVEDELEEVCNKVLSLLTDHIIKIVDGNGDETEVFYCKMAGDYNRYLCEFKPGDLKYRKEGEKWYDRALSIAEVNLNETHPTRLGLCLNASVFYTEIFQDPQRGSRLAKRAFNASIEKLDTLNDASYKDSTLIMQLLRDNMTLWNNDGDDDGDDTIGFAVGGARDINSFRKAIDSNLLPQPGSLTVNGLLYEYYFDTKSSNAPKCDDLFYPSYCWARCNPLEFDLNEVDDDDDVKLEGGGGGTEYFMTVGLNSNIKQKDLKRKKLNLLVILDKSGSMESRFANGGGGRSKMEVANECVVGLLGHLTPNDRFGVIAFDNESTTMQQMALMEDIDVPSLRERILAVRASGGTNFECGYTDGLAMYDDAKHDEEYDNRIVLVTDAQPNQGVTDPASLMAMVDQHANDSSNYIYTTFVGVGLDFNARLVAQMSSTRGCNHYSVHSAADFAKVMDEDFEYMVTPLVFNVSLKLTAEGGACCIDRVYGASKEREESMIGNGEITKIHTLFPSKKSAKEGGTKGGIQLIKLKANGQGDANMNVQIEVSFEDKNGKKYRNEQSLCLEVDDKGDGDMVEEADFFENSGIRKGILLCRYTEILNEWMEFERLHRDDNALSVSGKYKEILGQFVPLFESEMKECNDENLQKELDLLLKLVGDE